MGRVRVTDSSDDTDADISRLCTPVRRKRESHDMVARRKTPSGEGGGGGRAGRPDRSGGGTGSGCRRRRRRAGSPDPIRVKKGRILMSDDESDDDSDDSDGGGSEVRCFTRCDGGTTVTRSAAGCRSGVSPTPSRPPRSARTTRPTRPALATLFDSSSCSDASSSSGDAPLVSSGVFLGAAVAVVRGARGESGRGRPSSSVSRKATRLRRTVQRQTTLSFTPVARATRLPPSARGSDFGFLSSSSSDEGAVISGEESDGCEDGGVGGHHTRTASPTIPSDTPAVISESESDESEDDGVGGRPPSPTIPSSMRARRDARRATQAATQATALAAAVTPQRVGSASMVVVDASGGRQRQRGRAIQATQTSAMTTKPQQRAPQLQNRRGRGATATAKRSTRASSSARPRRPPRSPSPSPICSDDAISISSGEPEEADGRRKGGKVGVAAASRGVLEGEERMEESTEESMEESMNERAMEEGSAEQGSIERSVPMEGSVHSGSAGSRAHADTPSPRSEHRHSSGAAAEAKIQRKLRRLYRDQDMGTLRVEPLEDAFVVVVQCVALCTLTSVCCIDMIR